VRGKPTTLVKMQTREERCEALCSLLPFVEVHLDYRGDEEDEAEPCDERCLICRRRCSRASEVLYRQLRSRYPIMADIEELLGEMTYQHLTWSLGVYYVLVQPWDGFDRARREGWCRAGVEWLSDELAARGWRFIPTYTPEIELDRRKRHHVDPVKARDARIIQLRIEGASYHRIASVVGCSKSTVRAVLAAQTVRHGRCS
jgi:hypothetical protein